MDVTDKKVGQVPEGKVLDFLTVEHIKTDELKTFEFDSPEQRIVTQYPEFSAVCPFSGLPDIADVDIVYFPESGKAIELKSLKYYLLSFRNVGIYQEGVTKRIFDDLVKVLGISPEAICVKTRYNVRGGFLTTCYEGNEHILPMNII